MGGCWGANLTVPKVREKWKAAWQDMLGSKNIWASRNAWGIDQYLLRDHVWKVFEGPKNIFQHDSYHCDKFSGSSPWPTQRLMKPWNFVGADPAIRTTKKECPMACRPKSHPEWKYC